MTNKVALPPIKKPCGLGEKICSSRRKLKKTLLHTISIVLFSGWKKENLKTNNNARRGKFSEHCGASATRRIEFCGACGTSPDTMVLHRHLNSKAERLTLLGDTLCIQEISWTSRLHTHSYRRSTRQEGLKYTPECQVTGLCLQTVLLPFLLYPRWSRPTMDAVSRSQGTSLSVPSVSEQLALPLSYWLMETVATDEPDYLYLMLRNLKTLACLIS